MFCCGGRKTDKYATVVCFDPSTYVWLQNKIRHRWWCNTIGWLKGYKGSRQAALVNPKIFVQEVVFIIILLLYTVEYIFISNFLIKCLTKKSVSFKTRMNEKWKILYRLRYCRYSWAGNRVVLRLVGSEKNVVLNVLFRNLL